MSDPIQHATFEQIGALLRQHESFVLISHQRPDGDAIGSLLALGFSLMALGKSVRLLSEDGVPESYAFLKGAEHIERPPDQPIAAQVVIALDTATRPRLGDGCLRAVAGIPLMVNIDHHVSNPGYGDLNLIDPGSPATGAILYDLIVSQNLPMPPESRDAIYVAVSTDTGSFQYPSTTARTYEMGADLIRRGLDVGTLNSLTYDSHPFRRLELLRALLNTIEITAGGLVAHWTLDAAIHRSLDLRPEDSEGLIDILRGIRGVQVAVFFEELPDGYSRASLRSKDTRFDVCKIASEFGGGGHSLAAGLRTKTPMTETKTRVLAAIERVVTGH